MITPEELTGLSEGEYVEIIRYVVLEYEQQNTALNKLAADHEKLHTLYEEQMNAIRESLSQKLSCSQNLSTNSVGAFEVVEEAVKELSIQHEEEIKSILLAKDEQIKSITKSLVSHDNQYLMDQIEELQNCLTELTEYMTRDRAFKPPNSTSELCAAAKQFIVSNHAVSIAEMESKHMVEINQLKVEHEAELADREMKHAYSREDLEAKYDQVLLDKEDTYQEQLRSLDEQVYCLESELTMLKGDLSREELERSRDEISTEHAGVEGNLRSDSNEFVVHVTEHASPPLPLNKDSNRYREEKLEILSTPKKNIPKRSGIRPPNQRTQKSKQANKDQQEEMKPTKLKPVKEKLTDSDKEQKKLKVNSVCSETQTADVVVADVSMCDVASQTLILVIADNSSQTNEATEGKKKRSGSTSQDNSADRENAKFQNQVDQIEDLWNDLIPMDDSFNLADCSFANMDVSYPATECRTQEGEEEADIPHLGLEDTELLPAEYITSPELTENHPDNTSQVSHDPGMQNSNDLFGVSGDELLRSRDMSRDIDTSRDRDTSLDTSLESPHKVVGRLLAQQAERDALRDEREEGETVSTFQELQIMLSSREEVIEAQEFQIFELREALERSREETKRLNLLNVIHMDNAICRDVSQPVVADTACSPIPSPAKTREDMTETCEDRTEICGDRREAGYHD